MLARYEVDGSLSSTLQMEEDHTTNEVIKAGLMRLDLYICQSINTSISASQHLPLVSSIHGHDNATLNTLDESSIWTKR